MSKGILVALLCVWFAVSAEARITFAKNPYAGLEKAVSKMSKKEKVKTLQTIYEFMLSREDFQTTPIVVLNKEPVPDWLNNLLWETSNAGAIATGHTAINTCLEHGAVRNDKGILYPNSCMYAGNIICTQSVPPKCNRDFIAKEKPGLICDNGDVMCNPDVFMQCNDNEVASHDCVDPKKAQPNGNKGPKITKACITEYGTKTMEQKAADVAKCADFSEGGKVANALKEIAKFCGSLTSRSGRGQYKKDFAGNDQDCDDMLKFIAAIQGNKPPPLPVAATPEAKPEDPCKDYPTLCEGQDIPAACGSYKYTPDAKQSKECINVTVTQEGNPSFKETPKICNDAVKDNSEEGRARQMGWLHRPYKPFNWGDQTMIGRAATGSSDGNPRRPERVDRKTGRVLEFKDQMKEGLTNKRGYADLCWDEDAGVYRPSDYFMNYLDKTVKNPAQNAAIKGKFLDCAERNRKEMAKQGLVLSSGLSVEQAADRYDRAKNIWAMIRVKDVTNTHMAVKKTTGVAMRDGAGNILPDSQGNVSPICDPSSPCTEGTFVCAKTNNKFEIKDKVAEYVTIYSDRQRGGEYGKTQYVETGTYQTWDYDDKGHLKREDDGTPKMKFQHYPVSADIYDADEDKPFLQISKPVVLKNEWWGGFWKAKQSVMYSALENSCPWGSLGDPNFHNKAVARKNDKGEIDSGVFMCDSSDGENYAQWLWTSEPPKLDKNTDGTAALKDMKMFNKKTGGEENLSMTFNANAVGTCILKDAKTDKPIALLPERRIVTSKGTIRDNSRGIQSEGKPQVIEEPKK